MVERCKLGGTSIDISDRTGKGQGCLEECFRKAVIRVLDGQVLAIYTTVIALRRPSTGFI